MSVDEHALFSSPCDLDELHHRLRRERAEAEPTRFEIALLEIALGIVKLAVEC